MPLLVVCLGARQYCLRMRQKLKVEDEPHLLMRTLSVDYVAGGGEVAHSHSWPQLLYAQNGVMRVEVGGDLLVVPPRRGLWIPAAESHRLTMLSAVSLRTLYIRPERAQIFETATVFDVVGLLHEVVLRICALQWLDARVERDVRLNALALDEVAEAPVNELRLTMPRDPRALLLARNLMSNADALNGLSAQYSAVGLSRRTAERLFLKETGLSPARWYRLARLSVGLAKLASGSSIQSAALDSGYNDRAAFSAAFSKIFGFAPSSVTTAAL